jgi:L-fuconolactonase
VAAYAVVDSHAHIIANSPKYPFAPRGGTLPAWLSERHQTAEKLLASMDAVGVDKAVLVQYASVHGYDCSYVLDSASQHRDRFVPVCAINPADETARRLAELGAAGLRIASPSREAGPDWVLNEAPWQAASELQIPMCVHFIANLSLVALPMLRTIMERFPDVRVVLDHLGNPAWDSGDGDYGLKPLLEMSHLNLVLKFSTINLERISAAGLDPSLPLQRLVQEFGVDRLMWGSDAPNTPGDYPDMLAHMKEVASVLPATDQEWFFGRTAAHVYPGLIGKARNPSSGGKS